MRWQPRRASLVRLCGLLLFALPFLIPLLRPGWLQSHEGLSNPIRLSQVIVCWQDGLYSARWFPDLNFGQGYPFLCFYAPLVFYLAGLFHVAGMPLALALKMPIVVGTLAGLTGAYRLTRSCAGPAASLAAACLYGYAPYVVRDIWIRGDLSEYLALGFLPWAIHAVLSVATGGGRAAASVILFGALAILSHNIAGMFTGLAMTVTGIVAVLTSRNRVRTIRLAFLGGIGALLLTAFFWVPALYETRFVQVSVLTSGHHDVAGHFVSPRELLGPGEYPADGSQGLPMTPELGYPLLVGVLLFLGFGVRAARRASGRATIVAAAVLFVVSLVLVTRLGEPAYTFAPILRFVQFPWRLVSFLALGAAVLGGFGLDAATRRFPSRVRWGAAVAFALAAIVFVSPLLGPKRNFALSPKVTDRSWLQRQHGTTTAGEYLPLEVEETRPPRGFRDGVQLLG